MKIFKYLTLGIGLTLFLFSCNKDQKTSSNSDLPPTFSFEVTDSVLVDYLGDLKLRSYDTKSGNYLLTTEYTEKYVEVNEEGKILVEKDFSQDTKEAINFVLGAEYLNGEVVVLSETKGFVKFENGVKSGEITIPYEFTPYMIYSNLGLFEYENKIYYPRPMKFEDYAEIREGIKLYRFLYNQPFMESQDLTTGDTLGVMQLPETSFLRNGNMHGMIFPIITATEKYVLMGTWTEPTFYVYRKENGQINYERTVEITIPDWEKAIETGSDESADFFKQNASHRSGNMVALLKVKDYYLAIYQKGIPENQMPETNENREIFGMEMKRKNSYFAAVFDQEFNQLAVNIPFPKTIHAPNQINSDNELVASKDPVLSDEESEGIVLYKIKLVEE